MNQLFCIVQNLLYGKLGTPNICSDQIVDHIQLALHGFKSGTDVLVQNRLRKCPVIRIEHQNIVTMCRYIFLCVIL